jgi:hypothetical protein
VKGYLVLALAITKLEEFFEYAEKIPAQIEKYQGKYKDFQPTGGAITCLHSQTARRPGACG